MAKLSKGMLDQGRDLILDQDWVGFDRWWAGVGYTRRVSELPHMVRKLCAAGNPERAIKLFDVAFENYDPDLERLKDGVSRVLVWVWTGASVLVALTLVLFLALGVLGGIRYLFGL